MKNYNWRFLIGDKMTDEEYQRFTLEDEGYAIPDEHLHTVKINDYFISKDPKNNKRFLRRKLAEHGLMEELDG